MENDIKIKYSFNENIGIKFGSMLEINRAGSCIYKPNSFWSVNWHESYIDTFFIVQVISLAVVSYSFANLNSVPNS